MGILGPWEIIFLLTSKIKYLGFLAMAANPDSLSRVPNILQRKKGKNIERS
jgi:hypothetical protein